MRKKIMWLTLIILFAGIGIIIYFLFLSNNEDEIPVANSQPVHNSIANNTVENPSKKDTSISTKNIPTKNFLSEVKESTMTFFSKEKDMHIVAVGDSLTQGVGDSKKAGGYIGILDETINQKAKVAIFDNFGHAGDRSDQLLKRLQKPEVAKKVHDADVILITIGANDIMKILKENISELKYNDFTKDHGPYEKRLKNVFKQIRKENPNAKIYLLGFYNPFDQYFAEIKELNMVVDDWNKIGAKVVKEDSNAEFVPTKDLFENTNTQLFAEDNFHPNDNGYKLMATRVLEYFSKNEE